MLYMIFGGSGSGKSEYAEDLAVKLCPGEKIYLATLQDIDEEMEKRIEDHKTMRKGKHFTTVEQGLALETLDVSGQKLVLLECMTNLLANEMYSPKAQKEEPVSDYIMKGIRHIKDQVENLIVIAQDSFQRFPWIRKCADMSGSPGGSIRNWQKKQMWSLKSNSAFPLC